jgi:two-component system, chemotaxis family, chemotaxis protein CheY
MAKSILLVDDSATMRKIIMKTIRMAGLEVESIAEAGDGNEALEKIDEKVPDIIMCDVNMPGMGGLELVKAVRQREECQGTKIVMVSTESSDDLISNVLSDGANDYITKPFTPEKIEQKLAPFMA